MVKRSSGILLHPTSLPGRYGIGDLGNEAYNFVNFLDACGQRIWQIFPLGPTGYGDSPYQTFSAFAGNPLLISPQLLMEDGLLKYDELENTPAFNPHKIDYGQVIDYKHELHLKAFSRFKAGGHNAKEEFLEFCSQNNEWLDDYALFAAAKEFHGGKIWSQWDKNLAFRKGNSVAEWNEKLSDNVLFFKFLQFEFFRQWKALKAFAKERDITIIGDLPIFVAYDSADIWANKHLFTVDSKGRLLTVAGVPPDYFSATGQLWGNPLYKWQEMAKDDYAWWRKRFSKLFELVDIARIDHFRGFDAYWEIPGDAETAINGRWVKGPGEHFFSTIEKHLGKLPIIAEDLGVITKSVEQLRDRFEFPGIKIMQFAFGTEMENKFLPHNYPRNCVVHTGSHDNDTTRSYFEKAREDRSNDIYEFAQKYLNYYGDNITQELIRVAYASVADMVVIPMQDMLNLGNDARMNFPGTLGGNWNWRFTWKQVPGELPARYKEMTMLYDRPPKERKHVEIEVEQ
ncbi:MAG: 4-alpha-glucanotransferase [Bacteroidota bacterium]